CHPEIVALADYVGSTKGILDYATQSESKIFIIGTECGILYSLGNNNPDKTFILASEELICPNMKSITLDKVFYSLQYLQTRVVVPEEIRAKAAIALERMIEYAS
ncbi:MAG TPA: quinolinate synthase NadA, partial [Syntrophothermus lipocalidus]|nr:quinolinate synthase NadA [Syntrophothermus lipocalidus]